MTPDTRPIPRPDPEHPGPVNGHPLPWTYDPASDGPTVRRLLGTTTTPDTTGIWVAITPEGAARLLVAAERAGEAAERARTRRLTLAALAAALLLALIAWHAISPPLRRTPEPLPTPPAPPTPAISTIWVDPPQPDTLPARYAPWRSL